MAFPILAVLLVVASVLLVSNTIRLSLFSRRREVEVMKLVGATDWFIRWPFVLEGVIDPTAKVEEGPFGEFTLRKSVRPIVFVAGATGFAPIA